MQAILSRFPTAMILWQDEKGVELSATVEYGRGNTDEADGAGKLGEGAVAGEGGRKYEGGNAGDA